jgi:hypothetical protein
MLVALLLVVYIAAIVVAAGVLLVATEAFEPNRRMAWVLKVLIIGAAAAAVLNRLFDFVGPAAHSPWPGAADSPIVGFVFDPAWSQPDRRMVANLMTKKEARR